MNNLSFKYRFIISFVLVEIFFILLIVSLNFFAINNTSKELIKKEIDTTKHLLSSLVKSPVSVYDLATLDDITNNSIKGSLNSIVILDSNNNLLSKNYNITIDYKEYIDIKKPTQIIENNKKYTIHKVNVIHEDTLLGHILIVFDTNEIQNKIDENKINTIIIILFEILISSIIAYFLGLNLTSKLTNLANIAQKIGNQEEINLTEEKSKNEISILNNSLLKMNTDINIRNEKLKEAKIVFDNIKEAIVVLDSNKNILSANDSFYSITGYRREDSLNKNFFSLMHLDNLSSIQIDEKGFKDEVFTKKQNDENISVLLNINTIEDEKNSDVIKNYIVLFIDITKEKRKEELLQMQSKMATMGEMIGNIAHQWRQPLSAISSSASSAQIQKEIGILTDEELNHTFDTIIKSTKFLSETIEDFRNFFKTDKNIVKFDMEELYASLDKILYSTFKNNNISFSFDFDKKVEMIGYKNELLQALLNIINNAKDALISNKIENKIINITTDIDSNENVIIEIQDNAGGIPKDILPRIFDPYFTTKHKSQGTGIGLYMTHTIITQHFKGDLTASNSNNGAIFKIIIPKSIENN